MHEQHLISYIYYSLLDYFRDSHIYYYIEGQNSRIRAHVLGLTISLSSPGLHSSAGSVSTRITPYTPFSQYRVVASSPTVALNTMHSGAI